MSTTATVVPIEEEEPYWMKEDWVPMTKGGKQHTPNMIRNELQRHIAAMMKILDVNPKSLGNFMNPSFYKHAWSAVDNGT